MHTVDRIADELLVLRAQDGAEWAFAELFRRWQPRLRRHARRLCGDAETAADACQEAWLTIARSLRRLRDPGAFPVWVYRVVGGKAVDEARRSGRRPADAGSAADVGEVAELAAPAAAVPGAGPPGDALRSALAALPCAQRAVVELFYGDGLRTDEIAQVLDVPRGTVKSRLFHARRRLQRAMRITT